GFVKKLRMGRPTQTVLRRSVQSVPTFQAAGPRASTSRHIAAFVASSTLSNVGRRSPCLVEDLGEKLCAAPTARRLPPCRCAGGHPANRADARIRHGRILRCRRRRLEYGADPITPVDAFVEAARGCPPHRASARFAVVQREGMVAW